MIETKIELRSSMATLGVMSPESSDAVSGPDADAEAGTTTTAYGSLVAGGKKATTSEKAD